MGYMDYKHFGETRLFFFPFLNHQSKLTADSEYQNEYKQYLYEVNNLLELLIKHHDDFLIFFKALIDSGRLSDHLYQTYIDLLSLPFDYNHMLNAYVTGWIACYINIGSFVNMPLDTVDGVAFSTMLSSISSDVPILEHAAHLLICEQKAIILMDLIAHNRLHLDLAFWLLEHCRDKSILYDYLMRYIRVMTFLENFDKAYIVDVKININNVYR